MKSNIKNIEGVFIGTGTKKGTPIVFDAFDKITDKNCNFITMGKPGFGMSFHGKQKVLELFNKRG